MKLIEYENIVMPIKQYVQGALIGKSTIMSQGFHTSAQIHGYLDGDLLADPIQVLYDYVDTHPPANNLKYIIRSVDWQDNVASVSVEIENWHSHTYTDFFTLLKTRDQWKIVGKIFLQH